MTPRCSGRLSPLKRGPFRAWYKRLTVDTDFVATLEMGSANDSGKESPEVGQVAGRLPNPGAAKQQSSRYSFRKMGVEKQNIGCGYSHCSTHASYQEGQHWPYMRCGKQLPYWRLVQLFTLACCFSRVNYMFKNHACRSAMTQVQNLIYLTHFSV